MSRIFLLDVLKSNYCKAVFIASLAVMWILIPKKIFYGYYSIIGILFMITSSLVLTCFIRNIKERVVLIKGQGGSLIGMIFIAIGIAAMNVCTVGAPICGASVVTGIIAFLLPGITLNFFEKYAVEIIIASIIFQIVALYYMNCFKRNLSKLVEFTKIND